MKNAPYYKSICEINLGEVGSLVRCYMFTCSPAPLRKVVPLVPMKITHVFNLNLIELNGVATNSINSGPKHHPVRGVTWPIGLGG